LQSALIHEDKSSIAYMQFLVRGVPSLRVSISVCKSSSTAIRTSFFSTQKHDTDTHTVSNKDIFKSIPVNPSILKHIKSLGVGIKPKTKKKKHTLARKSSSTSDLLSLDEEMEFFLNKTNAHSSRSKRSSTIKINETSILENRYNPPPPFSGSISIGIKDQNASGKTIKRHRVKVLGKASSLEDEMPQASKGLPEVAIIGRSNVGKSTLLNALIYGNQFGDRIENRKYIRGKTPERTKLGKGAKAKVSNTPGETKEITFYQLSSEIDSQMASLILVDLPGFGFAYSSEEKLATWKDLMKEYLINRGKSLKRILFLIDSRHGMKTADFEFLNMLQRGVHEKEKHAAKTSSTTRMKRRELPPIQIVLTKSDLVSQIDLARRVIQARQQMSEALIREPSGLPVMIVSAKAGLGFNNIRGNRACGGILELQREIASLVPLHSK
jgi:GTP-binding protein